MRSITLYAGSLDFKISQSQMEKLTNHVTITLEDSLAARRQQDSIQIDLLRMYEGVPKNPAQYQNVIEGYESIEVTLGAIAVDSIYAQVLDLIFTASPLLTCRANDTKWVAHAKAMQRFVNFLPDEIGLREAAEHTLFDTCQLGTGVYYIPFRESYLKTSGYQVHERGPVVVSMPPEDVGVSGGAQENIHNLPFVWLRFWKTRGELEAESKFRKWDISKASPASKTDWVTQRRQILASTVENEKGLLNRYETFEIYLRYDVDEDGQDEDLIVNYDRTSKSIMRVRYKPYSTLPLRVPRYQIRAHLFYGIGVMEMLRSYQKEVTELHNQQVLNVMLANCRMFATRTGALPSGSVDIYPGRNIQMSDPINDIRELKLSDIYSSVPATQAMVISLAERRVGINDVNLPRPSAVIGSRTPGITTMSMLQQVNKRFTPAFDQMRLATSGAVVEAVERYSERVKDGDKQVTEYITELLGEEDGLLVLQLLQQDDVTRRVSIELTAASASTNREADRQNSIMLVNLLGQYYQKTLELITIASNPQTPPAVSAVAQKIAGAAGEVIERTIRTFDQVRDPQTFIVNISEEIDQAAQDAQDQQAMGMLLQALAGGSAPAQGVPS